MASLSGEVHQVVDYLKAIVVYKAGPFVVVWSGGVIMPLVVLPLSNISLLKSPARMVWCVGYLDMRSCIWLDDILLFYGCIWLVLV